MQNKRISNSKQCAEHSTSEKKIRSNSPFSRAFSGPRSLRDDVAVNAAPSNNGSLHSMSSSS